MEAQHQIARRSNQKNLHKWTSNTVMVVDTSGSMRQSDMWGTRHRLGSVWVSIALDFLAHRLESGHACVTDVLSIVTLEKYPQIVIDEEPCTWVLYNQIVDVYMNNTHPPRGHGPFLPALRQAEDLLTRNTNAACAAAFMFLSDGKPSDYATTPGKTPEEWDKEIVTTVGHLARNFGRRLNFTAIGIGDLEDFTLLEKMVAAAKDYHAISTFQLPSMTSSSLGNIFSSIATSLTSTQTEMTDLSSLKQRQVRDVQRESRTKAAKVIFHVTQEDFYLYRESRVVRKVYKEWHDDEKKLQRSFERTSLLNPRAKYVALSKGPFGEGAERFAYRFYEIGADGRTIVSKPLVAKESRLVLESHPQAEAESRNKFVKTFCSTQQLARRLSEEFNQKLDATRRIDGRTPRIAFLDCYLYELDDINYGKQTVLVEERLDEMKWHKWNANNGFVEGMKHAPNFDHHETMRAAFTKLDAEDLQIVEEGEEDEDESGSDDENDVTDGRARGLSVDPFATKVFTASEVAQAFSHFTYLASRRKRLVCDLQGVFDESANVLRLSDPVIHYTSSSGRQQVHGRTDRGRKGKAMFFETHECSHLCRLVNRGFWRPKKRSDIP
jgi:hypothetical protein